MREPKKLNQRIRSQGGRKYMKEQHLYEGMADSVAEMISNGTLRAGDRLPSLRGISRERGVSLSTAIEAYQLLESRGLVESRPQSGFFVRASVASRALSAAVPRMDNRLRISRNLGMDERVSRLLDSMHDPDMAPLGAATPAEEFLPIAGLNRMFTRALRHEGAHAYETAGGNPELRRALALRGATAGIAAGPEEVVVTAGCIEALELSLRVVAEPGDIIACESPTFFGILRMLEALRLKVVEIPSRADTGMSLEHLRAAMGKHRIKAVITTPNFSNPTGSLMSEENKDELVRMTARRNIPIIEDDIYGDLNFDGRRPGTLKARDEKGLVLYCSSFSKSLSPGLRLGWALPGRFTEKFIALKRMVSIACPTLNQIALAGYLGTRGYDRHLRSLRGRLHSTSLRMSEAVLDLFPPGTLVTRPRGGYVLWVELPRDVDSMELQARALTRKISIAPGPLFSARGDYGNYIRLNCGRGWTSVVRKALAQLGELCTAMARRPA